MALPRADLSLCSQRSQLARAQIEFNDSPTGLDEFATHEVAHVAPQAQIQPDNALG